MSTPGSTSSTPSESFNPMAIPPGTRIGTCVIRKGIGRGGGQMAYLAEDPGKGEVVFKVSRYPRGKQGSRERRMHQRFIRQLAYFLELDEVMSVARVFGHDMYPDRSQSGFLYMVQEWVPGSRNIVDWYRREPHRLSTILHGWIMLADACWRMEQKSICHRDLRADNVLMTKDGVPKIVDLNTGLAKGAPRLTYESAGHAPGWPGCYSPELCEAILKERATRSFVPFEFRTSGDLHALGAIFYEVLTGEHPFDLTLKGDELLDQIAHDLPDRPMDLNPEVPFGLQKVTMRLLAKKPEERYQGAQEVVHELEALLNHASPDWSRPFQTPHISRHSGTSSSPPASPIIDEQLAPNSQAAPAGAPEVSPTPTAPIPLVEVVPPSQVGLNAAPGESSGVSDGDTPFPVAAGDPPPAWAVQAVLPEMPSAERASTSEGDSRPEGTTQEEFGYRPPVRHWRAVLFAAAAACALVLALIVALPFPGQHDGSGSPLEKGPMVLLGKAKAAVVTAACAVLGCAELTGKVRPQDEDWFAKCSPEARKTWAKLGVHADFSTFTLRAGPNVLVGGGKPWEVRTGPIEAPLAIPGLTGRRPILIGNIQTGSDGASLRFNKLKLDDGQEFDVCAIVSASDLKIEGPGIAKVPADYPLRPPESELHAKEGFILIQTGELAVYFAK